MGGRLLVGQSGGPTAVINSSLAGVVEAARRSGRFTGLYGARYGIEGVLAEDFLDLEAEPPAIWAALRQTPAAALGACRYKLRPEDLDRILAVFRRHDIRCFIYIGGNDSADTAHRIALASRQAGYDLTVVHVPKTIDNDLPETDHCPGYGSIARFLAATTRDAGRDTEAMHRLDPVKLIEVMGRNAGWVAAATALAKVEERDAPHLICPPERPLDLDWFLGRVEAIVRRLGFAVVVVAETVRDPTGAPLGARLTPADERDAFGHRRHLGPAAVLAAAIRARLGLSARWDRPGTLQRSTMALASPVDLEEAYLVGQQAVTAALQGQTDCMVTLVRLPGPTYGCTTGLAPLARIANREKHLPPEFLAPDGSDVTAAFRAYAGPLIGPPLTPYPRLGARPVPRPGA